MGLIGFLDCAILPKLGVLMMICFLFYMIRSISCFLKSLSLCACIDYDNYYEYQAIQCDICYNRIVRKYVRNNMHTNFRKIG